MRLYRVFTDFSRSKPSLKLAKGRLVDRVRVYVRGGGGGQGAEKYGGIGGRGGSVVVTAHARSGSLVDIARREKRRFVAGSGENATIKRKRGRDGQNQTIRVPVGTMVYNSEDGSVIADLNEDGEHVTVAVGGDGGSIVMENCSGTKGDRKIIVLELKTIADVGLVGFPNAGKSTLLKALSNAEPKVADYPFTTVRPQLGVLECSQSDFRLTLADIPGLVEGASKNKGMGHRFLRHIERTKILLFVVDVNGFQLTADHPFRSGVETVNILQKELELYSEELAMRPCILAVNKLDIDGAEEQFNRLRRLFEMDNASQ